MKNVRKLQNYKKSIFAYKPNLREHNVTEAELYLSVCFISS